MRETRYTFCRICESGCGLIVEVEDNRIQNIRPNPAHVASKGFACIKGLKFHELVHSPDRVKTPLKRISGRLTPIPWDQALREIGEKVRKLIDTEGSDSVAMYVGNGAGFCLLHTIFAQGFVKAVGTNNVYASASQDCNNKFTVAEQMYGFPLLQPVPDFENSELFVIVGANPAVAKFSFNGIPNVLRRMKQAEARGTRIVSINPRKTETVHTVGEHIPIRPNTDVFFLLAFAHCIFESSAIDEARVAASMKNLERVRRIVSDWPPQRAEAVTGIPVETIRSLADAFSRARGASLYCSTGINQSRNNTLSFWLIEVINAVTGNLDSRGGTLVGKGLIDFPKLSAGTGNIGNQHRSRVGNLPMVMEQFPGAILPEEILTPGDGQVKALFVTAGNPALTLPDTQRVEQAFRALELMVCIDIFAGKTAEFADYVLPGITFMEHADINYIFQSMMGISGLPHLSYSDTVITPEPAQKEESWIFVELTRAAGLRFFGSGLLQLMIEAERFFSRVPLIGRLLAMKSEKIFRWILRFSGVSTLRKMKKQPNGILLPPLTQDTFLGKRVLTADGLVDLAPELFLPLLDTLEEHFRFECEHSGRFKLVNKRETVTHNSYFQNAPSCVKGKRRSNYLYINPHDAAELGLSEGDTARISTERGSVRLPVRITSELMRKVVAAPFGWGHQDTPGLSVASQTGGANINILTPSGPGSVDPVSGMAHLTGIIVDIEKVCEEPE
jgi:anaerobic selenocysteine-containing dehydrogenase